MAIQSKELFTDSGFRVKAIDTTGAGDSFDAGFLSAYLRKAPLPNVYESEMPVALCLRCSIGGTAGQPTQTELQEFLRSNTSSTRIDKQ